MNESEPQKGGSGCEGIVLWLAFTVMLIVGFLRVEARFESLERRVGQLEVEVQALKQGK